ncbi:MAG: hypothetical protein K6T66_02440 [Peptococcaceae bacterium]|nr:hypothetical protein [Peptococcaceae bacterium]
MDLEMKRERILLLAFAAAMLFSALFNPPLAGAQPQTKGNFSPDASLQDLGFNNTQPLRKDPDGNLIDTKTQNPFGAPKKTFVSSMSVATAGLKGASFELHDDTLSDQALHGKPFMTENSTRVYDSAGKAYDWRSLPKVMTAANINETTVYQQVLTAVLVPEPVGTKYGLQLVIEDYNAGGKPGSYVIPLKIDGITMPGLTRKAYLSNSWDWQYGSPDTQSFPAQDYKSHLKMAACRGRVVILVNQTLYDFALSYSKSSGYTAALRRSVTFNNNSTVAPIAAGDTPVIDLEAGDVNNDGLQDLAVTVGSAQGTKDTRLLLYKWEQDQSSSFSQPMYWLSVSAVNITSLSKARTPGTLKHAAVAVGNVTGRGPAVLVSGYNENNVFTFTYVTYNPQTGKFAASPQIPVTGNSMPVLGGQSKYADPNPKHNVAPVLACVSFGAPSPGLPQYIFYDGWIFQYDQNAKKFALIFHDSQDYCLWGNGKSGYLGVIFFDTVAGNLSRAVSNQPGAEQFAVLTENSYLGDYAGVRWYSMNNGQISLTKSYAGVQHYPALCGAVVKGTFKTLKYVSYAFAMSDPKVIAVLGASPAYRELQDAYAAWGGQTTTFGKSTSKEKETSHSVSASVGVTEGMSVEQSVGIIFNETISSVEFTVNVTAEFSWEWSKSTSVSTSQSFSAVDKDMVVITSTPCDLYTYQISDPGQKDDGSYIVLTVPYQPQLSMMNLEDYNEAVDKMNQAAGKTVAAKVPSSVLSHTAGDPRTYPSDTSSFGGIVPGTVVVPDAGFMGVGSGSGLATQSITQEVSSSKSFEAGVDVNVEFQMVAGFALVGINAGAGYRHTATSSVGSGTEISGSVLNLPTDKSGKYNQYNFNWELVGYKAYLTPDKSEECYVVNYLVKPNGNTPPPAPGNLQLISYANDAAGVSATIGWDSVKNASKYLIYRSTSQDVDITKEPYAAVYPQAGANNQPKPPLFVDNSLVKGQQYYYKVVAEKAPGVDSAPSEPLAVPELIKGFAVKTQPLLDYNVGDALDLSSLVITATMADNSTTDLTFDDLIQRGMTFSIPDGTLLSAKYNGTPIFITDPMTNYYVVTNSLKVTSVSLSSLAITTYFTVGSTDHAASLAPNKALTAHFSVANNQSAPLSVIAVVALFDPDGAMINVDYSSQTIAAGSTAKFDKGGFMLPPSIEGYVAKAFVLEGTQFSTSSLRPLSSIAQISG